MKLDPVNTGPVKSPSPVAASPQGVGLLLKTFQLLDLFSETQPAWSQAELTRATGMSRSTLSRLVRFLVARGYLVERHGRYRLGFAAIDLGRRAQLQFNLVELCGDLIEELAQATAETVILTGYDEVHLTVVCLAQIPSRQGGLRVFEHIGTAYPLHSGATAKAVLAFLPVHVLEQVLAAGLTPVNPAFKVTAKSLREHLSTVRATGYALTREETYPGVGGIAVPILTSNRQPLGSIAVAAPLQRLGDAEIADYTRRLLAIGERVTQRIGGQG